MSLTVKQERLEKVLITRLSGELDHHSANIVRETIETAVREAETDILILNLAGLGFMDSSGLGVILGRYRLLAELGGKVLLCGVCPSVHKLLEMAGILKIIELHDDEHAALKACEVCL